MLLFIQVSIWFVVRIEVVMVAIDGILPIEPRFSGQNTGQLGMTRVRLLRPLQTGFGSRDDM